MEHLFEKQGLMSHRGHRSRRERIALLFQSRSLEEAMQNNCPILSEQQRNILVASLCSKVEVKGINMGSTAQEKQLSFTLQKPL